MKQSLPIRQGDQVARRCACRGFLTADPASADAVERAVQDHQRTIHHQQWAAGAQLRGELVAPQDVAVHGGERNGYPLRIEIRRVA